jgi:hypothetical protein
MHLVRNIQDLTKSDNPYSYTEVRYFTSLGISSTSSILPPILSSFSSFSQTKTLKLLLRTLRNHHSFLPAYRILLPLLGPENPLEHPTITQIFESLVCEGDWDKVEELMKTALESDLLRDFGFGAKWECLGGNFDENMISDDEEILRRANWPIGRAGSAMVLVGNEAGDAESLLL